VIDSLPNSDKVKRMLRNSFFLRNILLIKPDLIIHVGADKGQDREEYSKLGAKEIIWLEADPENVNYLRKTYPDDQTISGIVSNEETRRKPFYLMENSALNSAIPPIDMNSTAFGKIIFINSHKLDSVIEIHNQKETILVIDVQGAEEQVLDGAQLTLSKIKFVIIEIAQKNMGYTYQPSFDTILERLTTFGLKPSIDRISHDESYRDVLFVKGPWIYLSWIKWSDNVFDKVMRVRHFMQKKHFPKRHYYCEVCGK
jgi:FkbM family methyltransferase